MRRALRLAEHQRLELVPVAGDFRAGAGATWLPLEVLPSASGMLRTRLVMWELVGAMVGR